MAIEAQLGDKDTNGVGRVRRSFGVVAKATAVCDSFRSSAAFLFCRKIGKARAEGQSRLDGLRDDAQPEVDLLLENRQRRRDAEHPPMPGSLTMFMLNPRRKASAAILRQARDRRSCSGPGLNDLDASMRRGRNVADAFEPLLKLRHPSKSFPLSGRARSTSLPGNDHRARPALPRPGQGSETCVRVEEETLLCAASSISAVVITAESGKPAPMSSKA